eukprot:7255934-Prymnesium_polylepis.1
MSNDAGIDSLAYYTLTSTNLLGSSLIVTLFMLITLSATGGRCKEFYKPYLKWWSYARWVFAWAFTTLVYSAYCCFQAFNWIFSIKFPDRYVEEHPGSDYRHDQGTYSSFGFCAIMSAVFPGIMSIVAIFLLGVANSAMFIKAQLVGDRDQDQPDPLSALSYRGVSANCAPSPLRTPHCTTLSRIPPCQRTVCSSRALYLHCRALP